jgi:hypothetical protein
MSEPTAVKTDVAYITGRVIGYGEFNRFKFPEITVTVGFGEEKHSLEYKSGESFFFVIPPGKGRIYAQAGIVCSEIMRVEPRPGETIEINFSFGEKKS